MAHNPSRVTRTLIKIHTPTSYLFCTQAYVLVPKPTYLVTILRSMFVQKRTASNILLQGLSGVDCSDRAWSRAWSFCRRNGWLLPIFFTIHQFRAVSSESLTLFWLGENIYPHIFRAQMLNLDVALLNLIFNEEKLHFNVFCLLAARQLSINLQQDSTLVILVQHSVGDVITLGPDHLQGPENLGHGVINAYNFRLRGASRV